MLCIPFDIKWHDTDLLEILDSIPASGVTHSTQYIEHVVASEYKIEIKEWYSIDVVSREYMVARYIASKTLDMLQSEEAVRNARS
jgi:hypothetical protein